MAPLVHKLRENDQFKVTLCVTGQHRDMLDQVLEVFDLKADYDLNVMTAGQSLEMLTARILEGMGQILSQETFDLMLVHGDVTTGVAAALSAFYHKIAVGHIEAGLRTGNIMSPWPEEMNRKLIGQLAKYHFAPTEISQKNLLQENIPTENIIVTGNTVIDALYYMRDKIKTDEALQNDLKQKFSYLDPSKKLILVTGHRRENFDGGLERVCQALTDIATDKNIEILYPVHLNPNVQQTVLRILDGFENIMLTEPQDYLPFIYLMDRSNIIITDSGGIQEEAPSLGKPVLVTRDTTERPEAVTAGTVKLVGTDRGNIVEAAKSLLYNEDNYRKMSAAHNPYGDGQACGRIDDFITNALVA
ncbi:MAG: UDP-N-acetylglucosamine 2-epimerase (non-hydrolyzing) [Pseudomonadota bacterium]